MVRGPFSNPPWQKIGAGRSVSLHFPLEVDDDHIEGSLYREREKPLFARRTSHCGHLLRAGGRKLQGAPLGCCLPGEARRAQRGGDGRWSCYSSPKPRKLAAAAHPALGQESHVSWPPLNAGRVNAACDSVAWLFPRVGETN